MIVPNLKKSIWIALVVFAVIIALVLAGLCYLKIGEIKLRNELSQNGEDFSSDEAYGTEADAYYNGKAYYYNKELINILCIGVDKYNKADKSDHQADALYLLSLDTTNKKVNIISISRNTLADIDVYDMNGEFLSTEKSQICLSYVYGIDDKDSSSLTVKSVSRLLYDLPISGYYTLFMDSIADIVDSVGGVSVKISEDLTNLSPNWKNGTTVKLNGKEAMSFLQHRGETNQPRFERQKQFIAGFLSSAKSAVLKDISLPIDIYNRLSKKTVTNIKSSSVVYFASELVKADFQMHSLPGDSGFDGTYETFEVDESALYEKVLDVFYIN